VRYTNNYPSIQAESILNKEKILSDKIRILHTKSKHWKYEQEWRHIIESGDKLYPWPTALISVYFGCKASISDINEIRRIIADSNVKYYTSHLYSDNFDIHFKQI